MRNETGGGRGQQMFIAWENGTINNLINKGTIYGYTGVINSKSGTIKNMLFSGPNSVTEAGSGNVIDVYEASNIGTITVEIKLKLSVISPLVILPLSQMELLSSIVEVCRVIYH